MNLFWFEGAGVKNRPSALQLRPHVRTLLCCLNAT